MAKPTTPQDAPVAPVLSPEEAHQIEVVNRRLLSPDPFRISSQEIPAAQPGRWTWRWENESISPNHMWEVLNVYGWIYATPADLACPPDQIGSTVDGGRITRGERSEREWLMKMPVELWQAAQKRMSEENHRRTFGAKEQRDRLVAQAGVDLGDQAASFLDRRLPTIQDSRELVKLDE